MRIGTAVRAPWARVHGLLVSRTTSLALMGGWIALLAVWLAPFQLTGQSEQTIGSIAWDWVPFRAVYVVLAVSSVLCTLTRIRRDIRRAGMRPAAAGRTAPEGARVLPIGIDVAARRLREAGYELTDEGGALHAVRNRWSGIGGSLLHLGLPLLFAALVLNAYTQQTTDLQVTEGQTVGQAARGLPAGKAGAFAAVGDLRLDRVTAGYFEDYLLFTSLKATFSAADGRAVRLSLSEPYWIDAVSALSIQDYDYAPEIAVTQAGGEPAERVVSMNLFPPGSEDGMDLNDLGVSISMIAYPDHAVVGGRDVSRSYNVRNPRFLVAIETLGERPQLVERRLVAIGEPLRLEQGATVTITGLSKHGTFRLSRSPAWPLVALALVAMTAGVTWRALFRRHDVIIWRGADGPVYDAWLDISGRGSGDVRFRRLIDTEVGHA